MGKIQQLSLVKRAIIGIISLVVLVLMIPLLMFVSEEKKRLHSTHRDIPPTPAVLSFSSGSATITGYVYHDPNKDGKREEEEKPFEEITILLRELSEKNDGVTVAEATTDSYGYFSFTFTVHSANSYMVKIILPKNYKTVNTNPLIIADLKPNIQKIVEFGLVPVGDAPLSPTRRPTPKILPPSPMSSSEEAKE